MHIYHRQLFDLCLHQRTAAVFWLFISLCVRLSVRLSVVVNALSWKLLDCNSTRLSALMQCGTRMNASMFGIKRSKVKVTAWPTAQRAGEGISNCCSQILAHRRHHQLMTEYHSCAKIAFCSDVFLLCCHGWVQLVIMWIFHRG